MSTMTTPAAPASAAPVTSAAPSPALRLLALVCSALLRCGLQHVAKPRREGQDREAVVVHLLVDAKRHYDVARAGQTVANALAMFGLAVAGIPMRSLVLAVTPASPNALLAAPSAEGVAAVLQVALRARMEAHGYPEAASMRVQGLTASGSAAVYVTGGDSAEAGAANARAVAWCRAWLSKHFPEFTVEEGRDPVSRMAVWPVENGVVRRALRLTLAGAAAMAGVAMRAA